MVRDATLRAGIYARQSLGKRKSIREQDELCTSDADDLGWSVADHYDDKVSASRFETKRRPGWDRLVADLDAGKLDVVVVWEASRGDRKLTTWSAFLDRCAETSTRIRVTDAGRTLDPNDPSDWDWLAREGVSAVTESNKLSKRTKRGQMGQAKSGRPHARVPFGYQRRYQVTDGRAVLVSQDPHPEQAPIVAEIIQEVANGTPLSHICDELNRRGILTANGNQWTRPRITELATNPTYIGKRTHRPKGSDKTTEYDTEWWPPLVDEETFYAAKRVVESRRRAGDRGGRLEFWLSGVAVCGVCGATVRGRTAHTHTTWGRDRYHCTGTRGCVSVPADEFEELVLAFVLGRLARPDVYAKLRRRSEGADREAAAARAEADRLRERLEEARESAADPDGISYAALAVQERTLGKQIAEAERRAEAAGLPPAVRKLASAGDALPEVWADMPIATRRDVARYLVSVTIRQGAGRGKRVPIADRVTIEWKGTA